MTAKTVTLVAGAKLCMTLCMPSHSIKYLLKRQVSDPIHRGIVISYAFDSSLYGLLDVNETDGSSTIYTEIVQELFGNTFRLTLN
jgi:hypothetical protein